MLTKQKVEFLESSRDKKSDLVRDLATEILSFSFLLTDLVSIPSKKSMDLWSLTSGGTLCIYFWDTVLIVMFVSIEMSVSVERFFMFSVKNDNKRSKNCSSFRSWFFPLRFEPWSEES